MVERCHSKLVIVVSGVTQQYFGSVIVPPVHFGAFSILENKFIGYADVFTLIAVVPFPPVRVTLADSLIRHLVRVREWCDLSGMKLKASNTKSMIVSWSRTCIIHSLRNCAEGV